MLHCSARLMEASYDSNAKTWLSTVADSFSGGVKRPFFCYVFWDMGRPDSGFWTYEIFPCTSLPQGKTLTLPSTIEDSIRQARLPIQSSIFEMLVVYNMTQMLFNAFVSSQLLREAWAWLGSSDRKPMEHENIFVNIYEHIYNGVPKKVRISSLPILMVI